MLSFRYHITANNVKNAETILSHQHFTTTGLILRKKNKSQRRHFTFGEFLERLGHHGVEHADKLLQINLAVIVGVAQREQRLDLLAVKVLRLGHLLAADLPVGVLVDSGKGGLNVVDGGEACLEPIDDGGGGGVHHPDELLQVDDPVVVDVAKREDGIHLLTKIVFCEQFCVCPSDEFIPSGPLINNLQ